MAGQVLSKARKQNNNRVRDNKGKKGGQQQNQHRD